MANIDQGEVAITILDKEYVLRPNIQTWFAISRQYGGYIPASQKLMAFDVDAFIFVIKNGARLSDADAKDLGKRVYENGLGALLQPLVDYLNIIGNGGRPQAQDGDGDGSGASSGN